MSKEWMQQLSTAAQEKIEQNPQLSKYLNKDTSTISDVVLLLDNLSRESATGKRKDETNTQYLIRVNNEYREEKNPSSYETPNGVDADFAKKYKKDASKQKLTQDEFNTLVRAKQDKSQDREKRLKETRAAFGESYADKEITTEHLKKANVPEDKLEAVLKQLQQNPYSAMAFTVGASINTQETQNSGMFSNNILNTVTPNNNTPTSDNAQEAAKSLQKAYT